MIVSILQDMLFDYTLRTVVLGCVLLGFVSGCLGSFAVLRKQSLLGDAISHAALPGVALAFMITLTKNPLVLIIGAAIAGWVATLFVMLVTRKTHIKQDAALGIVLSVFFGFGIFLLTRIQRMPTAQKAGLDSFLFGNASTLLMSDIHVMGVLGILVLGLVILMWKEFKIHTFDYEFAQTLGFPVRFIDVTIITLIVLSIVIGLQAVGVVLMSALVIAPAAAARQWTDKLGKMVLLAGFIGAASGVLGGITSSLVSRLPTGPTIVLYLSGFVVFSLFFSPHRGLFWDWVTQWKNRKEIRLVRILNHFVELSKSHKDPHHPHSLSVLRAIDPSGIDEAIKQLEDLGLIEQKGEDLWALTKHGLHDANALTIGGDTQ